MTHYRLPVLLLCSLAFAAGVAAAAPLTGTLAGQTAGASTSRTPPLFTRGLRAVNPAIPSNSQSRTLPTPIPPGSELTLNHAISIALRYHPRIREAAANTSAAVSGVGVARSYFGPQVFGVAQDLGSTYNGIANTTYYNPSGAFPRETGRNHNLPRNDFSQSWDTGNNYMSGIAVSQFLFDFGRHREFVAQRKFQAASALASEQMAKLDLIYEVSQRYFRVLQARQLIRVYQKAIEQRSYHFHEAQVKATAGLRPYLDVYVTKAELARAQLNLVDARNDYDDAMVALDNAMGLSEAAPKYRLANVLTYSPVTEKFESLLATAFRLRPDLKALDDQARAMGAQVREYQSDYYPTVNAVGGYDAMGTGLPAANNYNVGIVITWPVFNSFLTTDQIAQSRARQRAIEDAIDDLKQRIILQVQTAFLNQRASLQHIHRSEEALAASRAELELSSKRYQAGLTDIVELEDAQRHYTYDDATYAGALYGFSVAKAAVDQATGRSLSGVR